MRENESGRKTIGAFKDFTLGSLTFSLLMSTKGRRFLGEEVRETRQTERGNTRGGATKKREISRTLLSINLLSTR